MFICMERSYCTPSIGVVVNGVLLEGKRNWGNMNSGQRKRKLPEGLYGTHRCLEPPPSTAGRPGRGQGRRAGATEALGTSR